MANREHLDILKQGLKVEMSGGQVVSGLHPISSRRTREKAAGLASLCIMLVGFGTKKMPVIRDLAIEKGV